MFYSKLSCCFFHDYVLFFTCKCIKRYADNTGTHVSTVHGSTLEYLDVDDVLIVNNASGNPTLWPETLKNNTLSTNIN